MNRTMATRLTGMYFSVAIGLGDARGLTCCRRYPAETNDQ